MTLDEFLANERRTDLLGELLWLDTSQQNRDQPWTTPAPGFRGRLYVGHQTSIIDPLALGVVIDGRPAVATPVSHRWMPGVQRTTFIFDDRVLLFEEKWIDGCVLCANWLFKNESTRSKTLRLDVKGRIAEALAGDRRIRIETTTLSLYQVFVTDIYVSGALPGFVKMRAGETAAINVRLALATNERRAEEERRRVKDTSVDIAASRFHDWCHRHVPRLEAADQALLKIYYYRWFVVYRNLHRPSEWFPGHPMQGTLVYEASVGSWFSAPIGLPLPLQIREMRWMHEPLGIADTLDAWIGGHGALRAYASDPVSAALLFARNHPHMLDLSRLYTAGLDYVERHDARSPRLEGGGMDAFPVTVGSWVTGTEFSPDFFARANWDHTRSEISIEPPVLPRPGDRDSSDRGRLTRLYRTDVDTWQTSMVTSLAAIGERIAAPKAEVAMLKKAADALRLRLVELHRDGDGYFRSVDADDGSQITEVLNFDAALPFLLDDFGFREQKALVQALSEEHLLASAGLCSASQSAVAFAPDNQWCVGPHACSARPFRYGCCWNGPSWHYATSWVLLAATRVARSASHHQLKERLKVIWNRWTSSHFYQGDYSLPLVMEHYDPYTGKYFRVVPDYFHSAWIDVFFSAIIGVDEGETVTPLMPLELSIERYPLNGKHWSILVDGKSVKIMRTH